MTGHEDPAERVEDIRAERDALRRELADLRAWLSVELGLTKREPGPAGLTVLSPAPDGEIIAEVERLTRERDAESA